MPPVWLQRSCPERICHVPQRATLWQCVQYAPMCELVHEMREMGHVCAVLAFV